MAGMSRGAVRREMLDLPPRSITGEDGITPGELVVVTDLGMAAKGVNTVNIVDLAVTTAKIANDAITGAKMGEAPNGADTVNINNLAVTGAKVANNAFDVANIDSKFAVNAKPARSRGTYATNKLHMATQPAATETVVVGADTYEFNAATPPAAGTAGFIWVYRGAGVAAARANLADAMNGVIRPADIGRGNGVAPNPGNTTELMYAADDVVADITVYAADTIGGSAVLAPNTTATAETLGAVADVWDNDALYSGVIEAVGSTAYASVTVTATMITAGRFTVVFPFNVVSLSLYDRNQPYHDDGAATVVGGEVTVALTGGIAPNIQIADVIDITAFGWV